MTGRLTDTEREQIVALARDGVSRHDIAAQTERSLSTISKVCTAAGISFARPDTGRPDKPRRRPTTRGIEVVDLYRQGLTFQAIGERLKITRQTACEHYWATMNAVATQTVDAHRAVMIDELTEVVRVANSIMHDRHVVVSNGHIVSEIIDHHPLVDDEGNPHPKAGEPIYGDPLEDHGPKLDAGRTIIAAHARLSKLVGADAAVKTELNTTVTTYQVELGDGALEALK
jgi:hypothetical protein